MGFGHFARRIHTERMMTKIENAPTHHQDHPPAPAAQKVRSQLERILDSPEFRATRSQRAMLEFVVSETLAGRAHEIKGFTVATRVFGRSEDFDQATDPIVSIQANKLRRELERYYLVAGRWDPVHIEIPKGAYVPRFTLQPPKEKDASPAAAEALERDSLASWPAVVVYPFQNLSADPELDYLAVGLATELAVELSHYQEIRVLIKREEHLKPVDPAEVARFVMIGNIRKDISGVKVTVQLLLSQSGVQLWADTFHCSMDGAALGGFEEHVAHRVVAKIACEAGVISRTLVLESKSKPPLELKAHEAILRYYEFNSAMTQDNLVRAWQALERAVVVEPECGLAWAMLGRVHATNYSLELMDLGSTLEKARVFAEKGVKLIPDNQMARIILAFVLMLQDEVPGALAETRRAQALNPNSLLYLDAVGYLLTLLGDRERGPELMKSVMEFNPYHAYICHHAMWVHSFEREHYEQAYLETLNFREPSLFWEPLMRVCTFGCLGRLEQGKGAVAELLKLKPDFPLRGRRLIGYYIKSEDTRRRMLDALHRCGLRVE